MPVVLLELDDLKRAGRIDTVREAAHKADIRLMGSVATVTSARVAEDVWAVFEHLEPHREGLPSRLDLNVPDDRLVASALAPAAPSPGFRSDLDMQLKLAAVSPRYVEPPER